MSVSKRVGAFLCALALVLHLAFVPLRARATVAAGALTAVGLAVTVSAFLNLAGIYPFNPDTGAGVTFPEWSQDALQVLINQYNAIHASSPITDSTVRSFALGSTIAVANAGWNRLRDFVSWIRETYAPADNVQGVQIGVVSDGGLVLPTLTGDSYADVVSSGLFFGNGAASYADWNNVYAGVSSGSGKAVVYAVLSSGYYTIYVYSHESIGGLNAYTSSRGNTTSPWAQSVKGNIRIDGEWYSFYGASGYLLCVEASSAVSENFPVIFNSREDAMKAFLGIQGNSFSGVTADTATVTTPAAPAADSEFTGMQVGGLGQGATADALEDVIESGVQNREQPTVRQVEVEVQAGTEVDSETGEVTENPVVIDQADVIPSVAALTAPQAFLDALTTTMTTKFPFCLPFDIMRILSAFVKEPRAPVISLTFYDGFSDADYTVSVDLSPWDDVAAVVRQLESVLLLVGFWLNFDKFNVLNIILGQLG